MNNRLRKLKNRTLSIVRWGIGNDKFYGEPFDRAQGSPLGLARETLLGKARRPLLDNARRPPVELLRNKFNEVHRTFLGGTYTCHQ
jgi:hypothetical protein